MRSTESIALKGCDATIDIPGRKKRNRKAWTRHRTRGALPASKLIEILVPSFCWQTAYEILTMLELVDDTIESGLVSVVLHDMSRKGIVQSRPIVTPRYAGQICAIRASPRGVLLEYKMRSFASAPERRDRVRKAYA
jgi:hypothetical protein